MSVSGTCTRTDSGALETEACPQLGWFVVVSYVSTYVRCVRGWLHCACLIMIMNFQLTSDHSTRRLVFRQPGRHNNVRVRVATETVLNRVSARHLIRMVRPHALNVRSSCSSQLNFVKVCFESGRPTSPGLRKQGMTLAGLHGGGREADRLRSSELLTFCPRGINSK